MNIIDIKPGDIVMETKTRRERVVVEFRADIGLIAFDDSDLMGWSNVHDWQPTGRRAE